MRLSSWFRGLPRRLACGALVIIGTLGPTIAQDVAPQNTPAPEEGVTRPPAPLEDKPPATLPEGIEASYEPARKVTWYAPKIDPWKMFDVQV